MRESELRTLPSNLEEIMLELWMRSSKRTHHFFQRAHQDTPRNRDVFDDRTTCPFAAATLGKLSGLLCFLAMTNAS